MNGYNTNCDTLPINVISIWIYRKPQTANIHQIQNHHNTAINHKDEAPDTNPIRIIVELECKHTAEIQRLHDHYATSGSDY